MRVLFVFGEILRSWGGCVQKSRLVFEQPHSSLLLEPKMEMTIMPRMGYLAVKKFSSLSV